MHQSDIAGQPGPPEYDPFSMTDEELYEEALLMAIRLEEEEREEAIIDEDRRSRIEWLIEHQEGFRD